MHIDVLNLESDEIRCNDEVYHQYAFEPSQCILKNCKGELMLYEKHSYIDDAEIKLFKCKQCGRMLLTCKGLNIRGVK